MNREPLEVLHDIGTKVHEATILAKVLPEKRETCCIAIKRWVELALECVKIMERANEE